MKRLLPLAAFLCVFQVNAQSYLVNFKGTGESDIVNEVKVENLTSGESLLLNGTDALRLNLPTGINDLNKDPGSELRIYPNPMTEYSDIKILPPVSGAAVLTVFDISGRPLIQKTFIVQNQEQEFRLTGIKTGLYIINFTGKGYLYSGKLLSMGKNEGNVNITRISSTETFNSKVSEKDKAKSTEAVIDMAYNTGQWLKFTGTSGEFNTVITSSFTSDKELTFNFIRCKDGDNNNYSVVEIGTQIWMAENLRTTRYSNGDLIGTTEPAALNITTETNPKYEWVYYGYQIEIDPVAYGRLYTWHAARDSRNVCPAGWHLPSRTEYNTLMNSLSGVSVAGGKLKETGLTHWSSPNTEATNISGFTALPTGSRAPAGSCNHYTKVCYLWSSTERDNTYSYYCSMGFDTGIAYTDINTGKNVGLGIRCIRDPNP